MPNPNVRTEYVFTAAVGIDTARHYELVRRQTYGAQTGMGRLAVGMLGSEKSFLMGVPNRHGSLYPTFQDATEIAHAVETSATEGSGHGLDLILHYNTDNLGEVSGQLLRGISPYRDAYAGVQINGLTFEQADRLELEGFLRQDQVVVMQVHRDLLAQYSPSELAARVKRCTTIDYVWLDGSGGEGLPLDTDKLLPYVAELASRTDVGIGVGGGLNADTVCELIPPLLHEYQFLSWDGQRGLHTKQPDGSWAFDPAKAADFLDMSAAVRAEFWPEAESF